MSEQIKETAAKWLGNSVLFESEGYSHEFKVLDFKHSYGKARLLLKAVHGTGEPRWIETHRVVLLDPSSVEE